METSLRYWGDAKALKIHAKEKVPIDSKTFLQVQSLSLSALFLGWYSIGYYLRFDVLA